MVIHPLFHYYLFLSLIMFIITILIIPNFLYLFYILDLNFCYLFFPLCYHVCFLLLIFLLFPFFCF